MITHKHLNITHQNYLGNLTSRQRGRHILCTGRMRSGGAVTYKQVPVETEAGIMKFP